MPRPTDPDRYPLSFSEAVAYTIATAPTPLRIPCADPHALRSQFYGYFRALRLAGDTAIADALAIYLVPTPSAPTAIELRTRDSSPDALTVSAALAAARGNPPALRADPRDPQPFTIEASEAPNLPSA